MDNIEVRLATVDDAQSVGHLLHEFNTEFNVASPGSDVLATRLRTLLADASTLALLAGTPAVGVALITLRTNVWYDGPVALLDELYVVPDLRNGGIGATLINALLRHADARGVSMIEINVDEGDTAAQRFYERHGFSSTEPGDDERAFYFFRELDGLQTTSLPQSN